MRLKKFLLFGLGILIGALIYFLLSQAGNLTFLNSNLDDPFSEYEQDKFQFQDFPAIVVKPNQTAPENPWIWRARFWGHEPQVDLALLELGYHVVFVDAPDLYGSPSAVKLWDDFYAHLLDTYRLNPLCVLEGMSRGGLYVYNWASKNTDKVTSIYADAPVCDIKSWPGGKGSSEGSASDWEKLLLAYQIDEQEALTYEDIPLFNAVSIAKEKIPVIHVCGAMDEVVPMEENTYPLMELFEKNGHEIYLILKENVGHHPHSLEDPAPIVAFIVENSYPSLRARLTLSPQAEKILTNSAN
ncbi:alpha/beta hydrolase family protein [Pleomorphovibrio marinus]|uniref:alpha/beta hydrolase family protein n=1 Tax=Pleomorphovibrio marinus TaxID=2164132 RepID=UPI000E0A2173|nr:alpha/beta hydrolase [Pleomorphovibrio marinus]